MQRFVFWAYIIVSSVLVGLFAVGYSARYLHPSYAWGAEIVAVGLPYITILLVGLAGVAFLIRHRGLMVVFTLILVLAAIRFMPPTIVPVTSSAQPADLTLMIFNATHWTEDADEKAILMQDLISDVDPDLLALQESPILYTADGAQVHGFVRFLQGVVDTLEYQIPQMRPATNPPGRIARNDQPVLGRIPVLEKEHLLLDGDGDGDGTGRPSAVRTVFEWEGRQAVMYNVHLRSFGMEKPWEEGLRGPLSLDFWYRYLRQYRDAFRARAGEAEVLRELVEQEELPVLIVGDFNSTPHSWVFRTLLRGNQDAYKRAGRGWGGTYHSTLPLVRIDHAVAGREWQVVDARVLQTTADLSEHRPLIVRLRWRGD